MKTAKKILLTFTHLFVTVTTIIFTVKGVFNGAGKGQLGENMINLGYFKAFTIDSNDFAALASLIMAIYLIISLFKKDSKIPYWAVLLQYISAVALGLTFITTATFLGPSQVAVGNSYWISFTGNLFFFHFFTPLLVILAAIFGDKEYKFGKKENLLALIPSGLYAIVYIINAVILKTWSDFYGFTFGGHYWAIPPVLIIITTITFGIGAFIIFCKNKLHN